MIDKESNEAVVDRTYVFVLDDNVSPDSCILVDDAVTTIQNVAVLESHFCNRHAILVINPNHRLVTLIGKYQGNANSLYSPDFGVTTNPHWNFSLS